MEKTKLYLEFMDEEEGTMKLLIKDPKEELTKEEIAEKMVEILATEALTSKGHKLKEIKGAYKIVETRTDYLD